MMKFFFTLVLFFVQLEVANASCESTRQAALKDCNTENIQAPLQLINDIKIVSQNGGAVPTIEYSIGNGETARRQLYEFERKCYDSYTSCQKTCQAEAAQHQANMNPAGAEQAQQAERQCLEQPAQNHAAAQKAGMDLNQILPALVALLGQLKGDGGASGDACVSDPSKCKVDEATKTPGTTLSNNTTRTSGEGSFLDAGLNTDDAPAAGEAVDPSMAQFGQSPGGGGGGFPGGGGGGGPGGRGRGVAEVNADGTPKINFNANGAGGGGKGGGMGMGSSGSGNKSSGNPIASRVGIDGAGGSNSGTSDAAEKALQARGLASGQPGGISAAHAFDNFQKIEKRIQTERNKLAEL